MKVKFRIWDPFACFCAIYYTFRLSRKTSHYGFWSVSFLFHRTETTLVTTNKPSQSIPPSTKYGLQFR